MILIATGGVLAVAACVAFAVRKHLAIVGPFTVLALAVAIALAYATPVDTTGDLLDLQLRLSALGRLCALALLATTLLLVIHVWIDEPAYNFFPTALAVGACVYAVFVLVEPLAITGVLVLSLLLPVGSFTFHVTENRSVEAAVRHFEFVALGGSLALSALALASGLPHDQPATTFVLLVVILFVAFALMLAAIPFHTHAALLAGEAPAPALGLYFGVLVPATFVAFAEILTLSGILPAIVQVTTVQDLLLGIGLVSALGGAVLALGAADLRRLVVYSVIANLGAALVGMATLSGPGIVGALAIVLVTGACATQQLLAAGTLEARAGMDTARARYAPLAAAAFVAGGIGMIGAPPLVGFPGRFFVELIAYQYSGAAGTALVVSTLALLTAQLRAVLTLFSEPVDPLRVERRPVAGVIGAIIFFTLLVGGLLPDLLLRPIATFVEEFLKALRPL
ncbi:MAG: proton-conducting transporter membrane subunit [Candidatus Limnocylindria bacterium]|nr:proton-conducting transporter membrane subunit [Candidatus Limnocylindria bacterium]